MLKRVIPQLSVLLVVCLIAAAGFVKQAVTKTSAKAYTVPKIIIDAGHGGFDGGASALDGTLEKDINLLISRFLADILRFSGFDVIMTRDTDSGTEKVTGSISYRKKNDLENRLLLMQENPDAIYVSIHLNKFTTSAASGTQVFYTPEFSQAKTLGLKIQQSVKALIQPENARLIKQGTSATYLLKNAKVPAVIVECGFLSNNSDLEKLKTTDYQAQMAFSIACGIMDFYKGEF